MFVCLLGGPGAKLASMLHSWVVDFLDRYNLTHLVQMALINNGSSTIRSSSAFFLCAFCEKIQGREFPAFFISVLLLQASDTG